MDVTVPVGVPEILRRGSDVTIVTYGAMCRIVMEGAEELAKVGISVEVIDIQTLIPFDVNHTIVKSLKKTNRIIFADEEHRPAYGSDGDYFSKANAEDVFDYVYAMMNEADPKRFPEIYNKNYHIPQWNPEVIDN